jgi:hypothetical protein
MTLILFHQQAAVTGPACPAEMPGSDRSCCPFSRGGPETQAWLTLCFSFRWLAPGRLLLAGGVAFRDFVAKRAGRLSQNAKNSLFWRVNVRVFQGASVVPARRR